MFDKLVQVLVFGAAYARIADSTCSATTIRTRRDEWIDAGVFDALEQACLEAYDRMIGLDLSNLAVDGCVVKAPCGGEAAGRSPVDRGKQGTKRSVLVECGHGIPIGCVIAGANCNDSPLLAPTLEKLGRFEFRLPEQITVHLDAGYDSKKTRELLTVRGCDWEISVKGVPLRVGQRAVAGRANQLVAHPRIPQAAGPHRTSSTRHRSLHRPRRRDHQHPQPHPRGMDPLPLERTPNPPTLTYPRDP